MALTNTQKQTIAPILNLEFNRRIQLEPAFLVDFLQLTKAQQVNQIKAFLQTIRDRQEAIRAQTLALATANEAALAAEVTTLDGAISGF